MRLSAETARADVWQACCEEQGRQVAAREVLRPLSDALIRRCLSTGPWEFNGKPLWHRVLDFALDAGACPKPLSSALAGGVYVRQNCWGSAVVHGLTEFHIKRSPLKLEDRL